jgi:pimeloyl-ACP methyl ester carboxylesterase
MIKKYQYELINDTHGEFSYIDWGGDGHLTHINHSIGYCAGVYTPFVEKLKQFLTVVGLDNRGHGNTKAPADPDRLKNWSILYDDLERFIVHFNKPIIAIGHSMGGTISMITAIRRPDLVRALIMIEPGIMPPSWVWVVYLLQKLHVTHIVPMVSKTAKKNNVWPDRQTFKKIYIKKSPFRYWDEDFFDAFIYYGLEKNNDGSVKLCCEPTWEARCIATAPTNIWSYVPLLKIPVLILYGSRSTTFLPSVIKRIQRKVPDIVLKCFNDTGHDVLMERPNESVETIFDFLSKNGIF